MYTQIYYYIHGKKGLSVFYKKNKIQTVSDQFRRLQSIRIYHLSFLALSCSAAPNFALCIRFKTEISH